MCYGHAPLHFALTLLLVQCSLQQGGEFCTTSECVKAAGSIQLAMDPSVDPCQDFYKYACGGFELRNNIPAGSPRLGSFDILDKIQTKQLRRLVDEEGPHENESVSRQKMRRYYKSCMDLASINKNNVKRMQEMVQKMGGLLLQDETLPDSWTLNNAFAIFDNFYEGPLFGTSVDIDDKNVTQYAIALSQGRLLLGSNTRDYYLNKSVTHDPILVALTDLAEKYAKLLLVGNVNRSLVVDVIEFDKRRAEIQQTQADLVDRLAAYNSVNVTWLQDRYNFLNWSQYFKDTFRRVNMTISEDEPLILFGLPYFERLTGLVNEYLATPEGRRTLHNYLVFKIVKAYAYYIGEAFQGPYDAFSAILSGQRGSKERWELCMDDLDQTIGFPLGAIFAEGYFPPDRKARAETVISETVRMFRSRVEDAEWMDEETRVRALGKFDTLVYQIAYPDWLLNDTYLNNRYDRLVITDDFVENQFTSFDYGRYRELKRLRDPVDRTEWYMTPQTVNAYYDPTMNTVVFPAGILNSPFFYAADGFPPALNFGAVGGIAGHEITHGFDNIGRQYDKLGNLNDWWNPESSEQFKNRTSCFVEKFNNYKVEGVNVKGDQTLSENIADAGAVKVAYKAYKKFESNCANHVARRLVGLEDFTTDQLFFLGWAQAWCTLQTPAARILQVNVDSHSPSQLRVIGPLSNSEDFAAAFNCPAGTPMNAERKCNVW